jgi:hypothetical protein
MRKEMAAMAQELSKGFPTLARAYDEYWELRDSDEAEWFQLKLVGGKAPVAADRIRVHSQRARAAEKEARINRWMLEYYEQLVPALKKLREQENREQDGEEEEDPARKWLDDDEYAALNEDERGQRALEKYWKAKKKPWQLGRDYERFIGYEYQWAGWEVDYNGIIMGREDLGRDLICTKGDQTRIVQAKYWKHGSTVHEKHVFQLYGSVVLWRMSDENWKRECAGVFVTSTELSDTARHIAERLEIDVLEGRVFDTGYPCIKCNRESGIYHLPFDFHYDRFTPRKERGDAWVRTCAEAAALHCRRAWKWRGN